MTRCLRFVAVILFVCGLLNVPDERSTYGADRPNMVFMIVDDLNDLPHGPHGKPSIATLNIERKHDKPFVVFTRLVHTLDAKNSQGATSTLG